MKKLLFICIMLLFNCKEAPKEEKEAIPSEESVARQEKTAPTIFPVEHATAVLQWDDYTLYIDPVGDAALYSAFPSPDLILITDVHGDHLSVETLEGLGTDKAKIIVPQAVANK
ncbi:MAG: MBL fold metallo-hydrolase, partial [Eudoraea sp.]|nr:MBL fold metallo-hydrolase [Eudoraea sp.]